MVAGRNSALCGAQHKADYVDASVMLSHDRCHAPTTRQEIDQRVGCPITPELRLWLVKPGQRPYLHARSAFAGGRRIGAARQQRGRGFLQKSAHAARSGVVSFDS